MMKKSANYFLFAYGLFCSSVMAGALKNEQRNIYIPTTISIEAQQTLSEIIKTQQYNLRAPAPDNIDAWHQLHFVNEQVMKDVNDKVVAHTGVRINEEQLGSVPVLDIRPPNWKNNGKVLLYTHGGAHTLYSARSTLISSANMSVATGLRVISIDYMTAPIANWHQMQAQVMSVFKALLKSDYSMDDIAIYGDSSGAGLAISSVLNLRDNGMGMPAAVVLWSPWVDISDTGDTATTLKSDDPILSYDNLLHNSAKAYAAGIELTDPRVSPLYADFTKGFPPSMIQVGTKEMLLSGSVRLYQRLEASGQKTKLDVYEGMWHLFQVNPIPEAGVALGKSAAFINQNLKD